MKLKGIKGIALLVAVVLLLMGAMAAISAAGGEERHDEFRWDARYWWEALPLTAYERQHVREIMVLIFDRYFGTDITRMSPKEFEELGATMGPEKEKEALRLFGQYAEKRGFEVPVGIPVPGERPAEVTYWWELVDPEYRAAAIARAERDIPQRLRNRRQLAEEWGVEVCLPCPDEINVMTLTPEDYRLLLNPPPLPLRLWSIDEMRAVPDVVAVYGRARTYTTQADIQQWLDELRRLHHSSMRIVWASSPHIITTGVDHRGYFSVGLNMDELTMKEAQALAPQIYVAISEKAERLGIQDVPVVFHLTKVRVLPGTVQSPEVVGTAGLPPAQPGYDVRYRPIPGGVEIKGRQLRKEPLMHADKHRCASVVFSISVDRCSSAVFFPILLKGCVVTLEESLALTFWRLFRYIYRGVIHGPQ
ncbi:hypothetical protein M1N46_02740 [Dehalococcoidia bacterium]|nr:hypothetical protein [Dehalococcoidia bacterium]